MDDFTKYKISVNLVHIFIQGLLLLYIGLKKDKTPKYL